MAFNLQIVNTFAVSLQKLIVFAVNSKLYMFFKTSVFLGLQSPNSSILAQKRLKLFVKKAMESHFL
ncbi:MAG: hypothetical protein COY80_02490 [Candidatus Pacebacteria bacterium CG_4_10_14_0_8_um_filter_42_14]|nr:MAG: hypothetical protein COY80_02490 [Candidatus Pacebacteria bacterium CG_4_10_14_0_8_um_filter_42_14]